MQTGEARLVEGLAAAIARIRKRRPAPDPREKRKPTCQNVGTTHRKMFAGDGDGPSIRAAGGGGGRVYGLGGRRR